MKKHLHITKVSRPVRVAESQAAVGRGPKGPGVPPMAVQQPKRVGVNVRAGKRSHGGK